MPSNETLGETSFPARQMQQGIVILIVDDIDAIRYARGRTLTKAGYEIVEAATGEEALRMAIVHQPTLIVLDVGLPDIDGFEVCRRIKVDERTAQTMVLQVSASHNRQMETAAGLEGGADGYLIEPIDPLELVATVRALLRLAARQKENSDLIQRLSRSERQCAEATSAAECGLWDWHIPSGKLEWFGAHERLTGLHEGAFDGTINTFTRLLHPDDRKRIWDELQACMARHEERFEGEYRFVPQDGTVHWMVGTGRFIYDEAGRPIRMTGVVRDITGRKQVEDKLAQYRAIIAAATEGIAMIDPQGKYIEQNLAHRAMLGYSNEELRGQTPALHAGEETFAEIIKDLNETGRCHREMRSRRKDGQWVDIALSAFGLYDDEGNTLCYVGMTRDVTEQKTWAETVRRSEDHLRRVLDAMHVFVGVLTPNGIMVQCNTAPIIAAGLRRNEVIGRHFAESFWWNYSEESNRRIRADIERAAKGEHVRYDAPVQVRNTKGEAICIDVDFALTPLFDETGVVTHLIPIGINISDRVRTEAALRESEQRLRLATEAAALGIWEWNVTTNQIRWDAQMFRIYGVAPTADGMVPYTTWSKAVVLEDLPEQERVLRDTVQRRSSGTRAFRISRYSDGVERHIEAVETVRLNERGETEWVVGTNIDVTEHIQVENALRTAHDTFRHLVEQSPFGIYAVDADLRLVQVSAGAQKMFRNVRPLLGRDFAEVLHQIWPERVAGEVIALFRHTLETGEPYHAPSAVEYRRDSGELESYDWKIERIILPDGRWGVVCHFYDLSERQQYEATLREGEERLRMALEGGNLGSWDVDLTTGQAIWNQRHALMQGYQPNDGPVSMDLWQKLVHPDDVERVLATMERARLERGLFAEEHRFRRADTGELNWMSLYGRFSYDAQGEPIRFSGVSLDITERKRAEEMVQQRTRQLDLLARTSQRLILSDTPQELLESIFVEIGQLIDMETFFHYRLADEPRVLRLQFSGGTTQQERNLFATMRFGELMCGRVAESQRPLIVEDLQHSRDPGSESLHAMGATSYAGFPLIAHGTLLGTVAFVSRRRTHLRAGDEQMIQTICEQIATRLDRAQLAQDLRLANETLRESEERFRQLSSSLPLLAWTCVPDGPCDFLSRQWIEYTGIPEAVQLGYGWLEQVHPDDRAPVQQAWEASVRADSDFHVEFRIRRFDGVYRWFDTKAVRARDSGGRTIKWYGFNTDITERKIAEEAQGRLAAIVTSSDDAIISKDLTSIIRSWNRGAERLFGYTEQEAIGRSVTMLIPLERADEEPEILARIKRGETIEHYETVRRRKDGSLCDISLTVSPLRDEHGRIVGASKIARDITQRKRQEEELRRWKDELEIRVQERTRELEASQERLVELASQLSVTEQRERRKLARDLHDYLAQMLVVGQMKTSLAVKRAGLPPAVQHLMQDLEKTFQQALSYTRTLIAELSPPSLHESGLPQALTWLAERFKKDGLSVQIRANCEQVPLPEEQAVIVFQAVRELLFNVFKHAGVDQATVDLTMDEQGSLRIVVADRGRGMNPDAIQKSPEPGHLGLFSVQERLEAMGGQVDVISAPGQGTTVILTVPTLETAELSPQSSALGPQPTTPSLQQSVFHAQPIRILLVDDHLMVRQAFRNILASHERLRVVGEAGDGEQAVLLATNLTPDVVLMDINLPKGSGVETTKRLKRLRPDIVVIGLSAHADHHIKQAMLSAGANILLPKEGAIENLYQAIIQGYEAVHANPGAK